MTDHSGNVQPQLDLEEHAHISGVPGKKVFNIDSNGNVLNFTDIVIKGTQDNGVSKYIPVTSEGHIEAAIHAPKLPFGSVHVEELQPIFQADGVYGINPILAIQTTSGSGTATTQNSAFIVSTGNTIYSQGVIQSRKRLRYRAGQGVVGRFAAAFSSGVTASYQVVGFGHPEDGYYFGYKDDVYGILHVNRGVREVQTLSVATGASVSSNVTITLGGISYGVPVTNASNIFRTVYEISTATYAGWKTDPSGSNVLFIADSVGDKTGSFNYAPGTTGSLATIQQTVAGVSSTDTFIPQTLWNGDPLDGTGASGVTINPQKGNVYEIGIQYLGFGSVDFKIESSPQDGNNNDFVTVHTIKNPNSLTDTHVGNPSFPFTMAAYSSGSTQDISIKVGSFAGFVEGHKYLHGPRSSYFNTLTSVGATNLQALFTIFNKRFYAGRTNQAVINILSVVGAIKHISPVIYYLIKNGTLAGNPNFIDYSTTSCSSFDIAATTVTYADNAQLIATFHLGDTGNFDYHFEDSQEITLQPGEYMTLAAKSTNGTPAYVTGALNTREDQ